MAKYIKTQKSLLSEKKALKETNKRRLVIYPSTKNVSIFLAICFKENRKKSTFAHEWFLSYINKLSDDKKTEYLTLYKTLSAEQIKNIGKASEDEC